jgi:hypothetical protein
MATVPSSPRAYSEYSQFYLSPSLLDEHSPTYYSPKMHHQDHAIARSMHPSQSPPMPIDPALAIYPPYYAYQQPGPQQHLPQHLTLGQNYSSPSSQGSDTIGTPPAERLSPKQGNINGKRPSPPTGGDSRKKPRKDYDEEVLGPGMMPEKEEKVKPTRGSR